MVLTFEEDVDGGVYIADEDHIPREEDANHNVIALRKGEKVQVIRKSETGKYKYAVVVLYLLFI